MMPWEKDKPWVIQAEFEWHNGQPIYYDGYGAWTTKDNAKTKTNIFTGL